MPVRMRRTSVARLTLVTEFTAYSGFSQLPQQFNGRTPPVKVPHLFRKGIVVWWVHDYIIG